MIVTILYYVYWALRIYLYILIANVFLSWLPELRDNEIAKFINRLADPYMRIFRGVLVFGMFDFTPIIGFILYQVGLNYFYEMVYIMATS